MEPHDEQADDLTYDEVHDVDPEPSQPDDQGLHGAPLGPPD
jgi:hypothetical protein